MLPHALCTLWTRTPINAGELPAGLVGGGGAKEVVLNGHKNTQALGSPAFLPAAESPVLDAAEEVGVVWPK